MKTVQARMTTTTSRYTKLRWLIYCTACCVQEFCFASNIKCKISFNSFNSTITTMDNDFDKSGFEDFMSKNELCMCVFNCVREKKVDPFSTER